MDKIKHFTTFTPKYVFLTKEEEKQIEYIENEIKQAKNEFENNYKNDPNYKYKILTYIIMGGVTGNIRTLRNQSGTVGSRTWGSIFASNGGGGGSFRRVYGYYSSKGQRAEYFRFLLGK